MTSIVKEFTKTPGAVKEYTIDWTEFLETRWRANRDYVQTNFVRPTRATGFEYECTTAGKTSKREPKWPTTVGGTVTDGSVVWTARAPADAALDDIATSAWTADPGITIVSDSNTVFSATVKLSGGTDKKDYCVPNKIVAASGLEEEGALLIKVRAPCP